VSRHLTVGVGFAATLVALVAVLALAGCGSNASTSSSPAATQGGTASGAPTTYLGQAQAILAQVGTTAGAVPDAVAGLSKKPDDTWLASGTKLNEAATQLGKEASSLATLTPPTALKPVQDAVVKGLQAMQVKVNLLSGLLFEESADEATAKSPIQTQVDKMKVQIQALSAKLSGALNTLSGTPNASPTP
jgi:hypothetical protein